MPPMSSSFTLTSSARQEEIKPTKGVLPGTLTHLTFGEDFNQALTEGVLPNTLIHLNLYEHYSNMVDESINCSMYIR